MCAPSSIAPTDPPQWGGLVIDIPDIQHDLAWASDLDVGPGDVVPYTVRPVVQPQLYAAIGLGIHNSAGKDPDVN